MNLDKKVRSLVKAAEEDLVSRNLLTWLRVYPNMPPGVKTIKFEELDEDKPCMALSTIQGTYIISTDITGAYTAEYQFKIIYRAQPSTDGDRLKMDEVLNSIGDWAEWRQEIMQDPPNIGTGRKVESIKTATRSSLFGRYENGDEDHQIIMLLTYSVIA